MKVFVIRPAVAAFDSSGKLSSAAARSLDAIAVTVADALRAGGDSSHQASVWAGIMIEEGTPPSVMAVEDRSDLVTLARRLLDPNGLRGGIIRSSTNCRAVTFGQDGQAFLCLRHEDAGPSPNPAFTLSEASYLLAETDLFDGHWPPT